MSNPSWYHLILLNDTEMGKLIMCNSKPIVFPCRSNLNIVLHTRHNNSSMIWNMHRIDYYPCRIQPLTVVMISWHVWLPGGVACRGCTCRHMNSSGQAPCAGLNCCCTVAMLRIHHRCSDACGT